MERRRHARTPVNINAMLIGQKTVPKGCRVKNVSQQGMLLQCEPDGRLLTFSKGDKVEIRLTVQYASERKSLTIPTSVRHVNESYIYVEFQHPDLKLVELIESYRVSEAHQLEASVDFGDARHADDRVTTITANEAAMQADAQQVSEKKRTHRPFYYGLLTLVLVICIITGGYIYTASIDTRLGMLETLTGKQAAELADMRERVFSSTLQEGRYASLNARMTALTEAFSSLESKLTGLVSQRQPDIVAQISPTTSGDSPILISSRTPPGSIEVVAAAPPSAEAPIPAISAEPAEAPPVVPRQADKQLVTQPATEAAAPIAGTANGQQQKTATAGAVSVSAAEAIAATDAPVTETTASQENTAAASTSLTATGKQGPWVINLLSSTDKGYVDRYAARARSRDVAVEVNSAEVKGRTYWRMQITGFPSGRAARAEADGVREKLGIKDVWIFRR